MLELTTLLSCCCSPFEYCGAQERLTPLKMCMIYPCWTVDIPA